jgi:hypothetical protein
VSPSLPKVLAICANANLSSFVRYRIALMELSIQKLELTHAVTMPSGGHDPYRMMQIHDYAGVKMPLFDYHIRAAMSRIITVFAANYPELLSEQFLVNVPVFDSFIIKIVQGILYANTHNQKRLNVLRKGTKLPSALPDLGMVLPPEYGGKGASVRDGETVRLLEYTDGVYDAQTGTASEPAHASRAVSATCYSSAGAAPHMAANGAPAAPVLSDGRSDAALMAGIGPSNHDGASDDVPYTYPTARGISPSKVQRDSNDLAHPRFLGRHALEDAASDVTSDAA